MKLDYKVYYFLYFCCILLFSLISPIRNPQNTLFFLINVACICFLYFKIINLKLSFDLYKLIIIYIISRLFIFPMYAWLSDDVFTYLWQGKLIFNNINVYSYLPLDNSLIYLRDGNFFKMGNLNVSAIYPPISVLFFYLNYTLNFLFNTNEVYQFYTWKFLLILFELIALFIISKINSFSKDKIFNSLAIYILCPLPLIEIIGQGHIDGLLLPFIALLIYILLTFEDNRLSKYIFLGANLSLGILIKLIPLLTFPLFLLKINYKKKIILTVSMIIPIIVFGLLFFGQEHTRNQTIESMNYYSNNALFFSAPLEIIKWFLNIFDVKEYWTKAPYVLNFFKYLLLLFLYFYLPKQDKYLLLFSFGLIYIFSFLLSTKVHSWYFAPPILLYSFLGNKKIIIAFMISLFSYYPYLFSKFTYYPSVDILLWVIAISFYFAKFRTKQLS